MGMAQFNSQKANNEKVREITTIGTERIKYFDGIGRSVQSATSLETAIALSGLNFEVVKYPLKFTKHMAAIDEEGRPYEYDQYYDFPNQYATVRTDTMEGLGVVGKNYEILQNLEAFNFLDSMVGQAKFETAGSYGPVGARSFITMSTDPMKILDDDFMPYILFTNSFDGTGSVRVMFTPIRVFCSNCLVRAMKAAEHKIAIRHSSNLKERLEQARYVLLENTRYLEAIKAEAEKLVAIPYTNEQFKDLVRSLFVVKDKDKPLMVARSEAVVEKIMEAYNRDDLQNFNNTAYKVVQAFMDFESHKPAFKATKTIDYKNIGNIIAGMPLTNKVTDILLAA